VKNATGRIWRMVYMPLRFNRAFAFADTTNPA
jgi:hypothetical protein